MPATKSTKKQEFKEKLVKKYRLVVLTDDSFEEKFSFKLTRLNVFVVGGVFSIFLIIFTIGFIVYTPLKEYIPGFESPEVKRKAIAMNFKLDSIQREFHKLELFTESLKPVLVGDGAIETEVLPYVNKKGEKSVYQVGIVNSDSIHRKIVQLQKQIREKDNKIQKLISLKLDSTDFVSQSRAVETREISQEELKLLEGSSKDSIFRANIEREERFSLFGHEENKVEQVFVSPVEGSITEYFNASEKHFAVDIATAKDMPVKAVCNGVVVFAEWSLETGYVLIVLHENNYASVYKHNSKLHVNQNDYVKTGQIIANVGSTGSLSTSSHLHFELWKDGYPIDPTNLMKF